MDTQVNWKGIVPVQAVLRPNTKAMFRQSATLPTTSPIDVFIANTNAINMLYIGQETYTSGLPPELGSLVLLGYMSAVESYFRAVIRNCIRMDEGAKKAVESLTVSYAAALHHEVDLLPEALLEGTSFAGKKAIDFTKSVLGLKGNTPGEVDSTLTSFLAICEIRHCCVHRFGKLGSQNAIKLGLEEFASLIEKPFEPTLDDLQEIADVLRTFIKSVNNWLWSELLQRTARAGPYGSGVSLWTWNWSEDQVKFMPYYNLFASTQDSPQSPACIDTYTAFAQALGPTGAPFPDVDDDD